MKHLQNAVRLVVVVFWISQVGIVFSVLQTLSSIAVLGWPTILFYFVVQLVILYVGICLTPLLWRIK